MHADHLFDEIDLATDVGSMGRHEDVACVALRRVPEPRSRGASRIAERLRERNVDAGERRGRAARKRIDVFAHGERAPPRRATLHVHAALHRGAAGERRREGDGAIEDACDVARVDAALEAMARLGVHPVAARGAANAARSNHAHS